MGHFAFSWTVILLYQPFSQVTRAVPDGPFEKIGLIAMTVSSLECRRELITALPPSRSQDCSTRCALGRSALAPLHSPHAIGNHLLGRYELPARGCAGRASVPNCCGDAEGARLPRLPRGHRKDLEGGQTAGGGSSRPPQRVCTGEPGGAGTTRHRTGLGWAPNRRAVSGLPTLGALPHQRVATGDNIGQTELHSASDWLTEAHTTNQVGQRVVTSRLTTLSGRY